MGQVFKVSGHDDGRRLDKIIRKKWPDLPLAAMMRAFRKGLVRVDGRRVECSSRVGEGNSVTVPWDDAAVETPKPSLSRLRGSSSTIDIIYADNDICIVNKPWNLLSQPDLKGGESVISRVMTTLGWKDTSFFPTPVHRLDRNTSGAMALALNGVVLRMLHEAWRKENVQKAYLALVIGETPGEGEVDSPLLKSGEDNIVGIDASRGRKALTRFRKISGDSSISLLLVELLTGRPHQARVHLASIGHPLIGDIKYGDRKANAEWRLLGVQRPMLHSRSLEFRNLRRPGPPLREEVSRDPPSRFHGSPLRKGLAFIRSRGIMSALFWRKKLHGGIGYERG